VKEGRKEGREIVKEGGQYRKKGRKEGKQKKNTEGR
jgi:hypothetical protein